MKIAMTHVDLPNEAKGGVAAQSHYLANALVEQGHEVTMFTFSPAYDECRYQVHQYALPTAIRRLRLQSFFFAACLAQTDFSEFDIVHTHGDNYLLFGCHPHLRTFHGSAIDEAKHAVRLRRRIYQTVIAGLEQMGSWVADVNIGVSRATQKRIPAVSTIISCGVDLSRFRPGKKADYPCILFVGTVGGRKRGAFLATIFVREVRSRFPNAELWTVADQPIQGEGVVNFGKVPLEKICELYQRAWVFCMPSTYEGFGVPYIEAMACGTAVVASPNLGACEVLDDGKYGVLATDSALGEQINGLLANETLRSSYVAKGLLRAKAFDWQEITKQYEDIYLTTIAESMQSKRI